MCGVARLLFLLEFVVIGGREPYYRCCIFVDGESLIYA